MTTKALVKKTEISESALKRPRSKDDTNSTLDGAYANLLGAECSCEEFNSRTRKNTPILPKYTLSCTRESSEFILVFIEDAFSL